jgi:hypothetical protein
MTLVLRSCAALLLFSAVSRAAFVYTSNFDESTGRQLPITTAAGVPIQQGGIVQIGTFDSADVAALIGALPSAAGMEALVDDFIPFGTPTAIGAEFSGLFYAERTVTIETDSTLVGKPIYTFIGNGPTFAASTQLALVRHPVNFDADQPIFSALTDISAPYASVMMGSPGPTATTALGFSTSSLSLATAIPEPEVCILFGLGLTLVLRRRQR